MKTVFGTGRDRRARASIARRAASATGVLASLLASSLLVAGLVAATAGPAAAQQAERPARATATMSNAFDGLGVDGGEPIQFEAEALEVRENDRIAVFSGNVVVRQKTTVLKAETLTVHYEGEPGSGAQRVERIEAGGKVLVSSGPQTASGDSAVFDTAARTIVVTGNVVLTQGENVIRGPRLRIDIASGQAKMEGGRVQMLIEPRTLQRGTN